MGKPTGFLDYERVEATAVSPKERIKNFNEFHTPLSEDEQRKQSSRCMDCGVPFCQSGMTIKGMTSGCPLNNLIPEWNDLLYTGNWEQAYHRLHKTSNFPEFTSRVCPALCEKACTCGLNGKAVCTKENEMAIIEHAYAKGYAKANPPKVRTKKRIAVVGSGPAGLAVADQLNQRGHSVTVYERADRIGGLLRYGIPNMKLEKHIIDRKLDIMKEEGIEFVTNANVGENIKAKKLMADYDAVVLACGAANPRDINAPGRDANGIYFAVDFLTATTKSLLDSGLKDGRYISAKDKNVIVIGGGNVAMDVARSSIRLGASKVSIVYRRRKADMTALEEEVEGAEAEGCDVLELMSPVRIKQDEEGNAIGLIVKPQMISRVSHGRPAPKAAAKDEVLLESDLIVVAIGQGIETKSFEEHGIKVQRGVISALNTGNITPQDGEMSEGVFAGGDCVTGPATVIKAIAAGKVAAANIDEYLGFNHEITCDVEIPYASNEDKVACGRVEVALRDAAERKNDFEPIEYGFSCEEACQEAGRCLRCDHFGFGAFRGGREEQW